MIDVIEQVLPVERILTGTDSFTIGESVRLKITSGDTEIFNDKVPNNKQWQVTISLRIEESSS